MPKTCRLLMQKTHRTAMTMMRKMGMRSVLCRLLKKEKVDHTCRIWQRNGPRLHLIIQKPPCCAPWRRQESLLMMKSYVLRSKKTASADLHHVQESLRRCSNAPTYAGKR